MSLTREQSRVLEHLRAAYMGPEHGEEEVIDGRPSSRYSVGILFPREVKTAEHPLPMVPSGRLDAVTAEVEAGELDEDVVLTPVAETWRPSSAAISFATDGKVVSCAVSAGTYARLEVNDDAGWRRRPWSVENIELSHDEPIKRLFIGQVQVEVGSRWRGLGAKWLVTAYIRVLEVESGSDIEDIPKTLFQLRLSVRPCQGGRLLEYTSTGEVGLDEEARELRFRYREQKIFAVGHGLAADWVLGGEGDCAEIYLDPVPHYVVRDVDTQIPELTEAASQALDVRFLESIWSDRQGVVSALASFVTDFERWVSDQESKAKSLGEEALDITVRCRRAVDRMQDALDRLGADDEDLLRQSFALGMTAMRMQMERSEHRERAKWRPFQLGFILLALLSSTEEDHAERDLVDLIWFPTGGGKTEAYLAIAAIVIFHRRLKHGIEGGGTAVLTRYTMRLLTSQQFQRAASLICAMEVMRSEDPRVQGMVGFSIGLWVGNQATPGSRDEAVKAYSDLRAAKRPKEANQFQVAECPWCGATLLPEERERDDRLYGIRNVGGRVKFYCTNGGCPFFMTPIPLVVVDQEIYDEPPTIVLATVDKFARLQFLPRAGRILGLRMPNLQPSLIIQDELHLLSGPLGTTVAVFDAVLQVLMSTDGVVPKIIASTATIRSSAEQVRELYGRRVEVYPPAGLSDDANFFARPSIEKTGRLYVGLMPQSMSQASALVAAATPLLEIPIVAAGDDASLDDYWTLVMYHNSLRELGRSNVLLMDDISARLKTRSASSQRPTRHIRSSRVIELTGKRGAEELPDYLKRLSLPGSEANAVDVVLSSSMLSVGIDVQRLGLMLMVGQPKTTSEYIQSTSRVGRGRTKGVVVTLFRSNRARDRSHFETFRAFHQALYRGVEPTSVTPWSTSSVERSLAGAIVMLLRQSVPDLASEEAAINMDLENESLVRRIDGELAQFFSAVGRSEAASRSSVEETVRSMLRSWNSRARDCRAAGQGLLYVSKRSGDNALLRRFGEMRRGWVVADSMRSVEPNVSIEIMEPQGGRR